MTDLGKGRADELATQLRRVAMWENTPNGEAARRLGVILDLATEASRYAPGTAPDTVGRILIGVASVLAHAPSLKTADAINIIAAAGADLIDQQGGST